MKYAFIIEPRPVWNENSKQPETFKIGIYDLPAKDFAQVDIPTHHVSGKLHDIEYFGNGKLTYKVDGAFFIDVPFVPSWQSLKTIEVHSERWIKMVGWGKSILVTDDLYIKF